jgi:hypothetical protein
MRKIIFILLIAAVLADPVFWYTKEFYNGTADFNKMMYACEKIPFSAMCSKFILGYGKF